MRKFRACQDTLEQFSVMDKDLRPSFNDGLQFLASIRHQSHKEIQAYQSCRGDQTSNQGVVASVHRVLYRIRQDEKQNKIKRRQLTHLALSGNTQKGQKEHVNDCSSYDEFTKCPGSA